MGNFQKLEETDFFLSVIEDGKEAFSDIEIDRLATELPEDLELSEYQYYVQKVGFYLVNTVSWCKQLDLAIDLLSNFDYSKKNASRADHLIYNIENYLIRIKSVHDRVLQLVNAVFHLCINEEKVNHGIIVSNYKVQHRPDVHKAIKAISRYLKEHEQARHTLIHRHSLLDRELKKFELFYLNDFEHIDDEKTVKAYKYVRTESLKRYLSEKKSEFSNINNQLYNLVDNLFGCLKQEYQKQKKIVE
ncbi:Cthe_2314 family HEPN domain-containing protein [Marinobacter pelagius]|uniref:Cthe_2314 family HEPN domain-containing protein n=1 Tax=Marinobacter sp. C7 TaxID=2951363 RepID=UPI001EEF8810|nr:Cthe_2314 family HEPN domain-containing protein [Marinobacter sp. C7]MCG7200222.1 Cthe_2314 family HEPN domain-containing protein [Marinobacter sp. C7]